MLNNAIFEGIFPVLSLPFTEKKEIDYESLKNLINFCINKNCNGLVMFGVASEFYKITDEESREVIQATVKENNHRVPLIIGAGKLSTETTIMQAKFCEETGADGIMIFPPYFIPLNKMQLFNHYEAVANSVKIPLIIQDAPQVSGVCMDMDFYIQLCNSCDNIRYAKMEGPFSGPKIQASLAALKDRIQIFDGWGGMYFYEHLLRGVCGLMPGCSAVDIWVEIFNKFKEGKIEEVKDLYRKILSLIILQNQENDLFIACEKEMLKHRGVIKSISSRNPAATVDEVIKGIILKNLDELVL